MNANHDATNYTPAPPSAGASLQLLLLLLSPRARRILGLLPPLQALLIVELNFEAAE